MVTHINLDATFSGGSRLTSPERIPLILCNADGIFSNTNKPLCVTS